MIVDVEATRAIRQAEVGAARTMLERTETRFGMKPVSLAADSAYGSADSLAWLVKKKQIAPHIPVFDKSNRTDGTFSRIDFKFDPERDRYTCPPGKELVQFRRTYATPRSGITAEGTRIYRASKLDCDVCELKAQCCPNDVARKIPRDLHEDARDVARALAATPQYAEACRRRKKIEMLFAHLKRILRLTRLRLRGPNGASDEFLLAATAQNLRRLARLRPMNAPSPSDGRITPVRTALGPIRNVFLLIPNRLASLPARARPDFFNDIRKERTFPDGGEGRNGGPRARLRDAGGTNGGKAEACSDPGRRRHRFQSSRLTGADEDRTLAGLRALRAILSTPPSPCTMGASSSAPAMGRWLTSTDC